MNLSNAPAQRAVLQMLRDRPGLTRGQLAEALGMSPNRVGMILFRLAHESGLAEASGAGRYTSWRAVDVAVKPAAPPPRVRSVFDLGAAHEA